MKILYISKLKNSLACGVTASVLQLLKKMPNYADILLLNLGKNFFNLPNELIIKPSILDRVNVDLAIFEDPFNSIEFIKIAKILRKKNIPYVLSPHGCFHKTALKHNYLKKVIAIKTIYRSYLKYASATQFLTEGEMNNSIKFGDTLVIPNGIEDKQCFSVKTTNKKICFIGRKDVKTKGLDLLLNACNALRNELFSNKIEIHIYGSIHTKADELTIDNFIQQNELDGIVFNHGPVFDKEKDEVLSNSDIFIQTSRNEGFPMSILEALSFGLPVAITRNTNVDFVVDMFSCGYVCDSSVNDIKKMLLEIINDGTISEKSINARLAATHFSWDRVCENTVKIYQELISK